MAFRRSIFLVLAVGVVDVLVACGDRQYQAPAISVAFSPGFTPPASLNTGAYAGIAATVLNDAKNAGVAFTCKPNTPSGACGTFTPASAASTTPACYLAPEDVPSENPVSVTATSITDPTKSVSATITIVSGAGQPCP